MKYLFYIASIVLFLSCESENSAIDNTSDSGTGGSTARFAVVGDRLYTVSESDLNWFDVSDPEDPIKAGNTFIGRSIETIFPKGNNLFIGSRLGIYLYKIESDGTPVFVSDVRHFQTCDPVVADDEFAYVTLSSGNICQTIREFNELQIVQLNNYTDMALVKTIPMDNPKGLGVRNNKLFVCDNGLKVYDTTNAPEINFLKKFDIRATDVIALPTTLLVIGDDGFYQYKYENNSLTLLSHLPVEQEI